MQTGLFVLFSSDYVFTAYCELPVRRTCSLDSFLKRSTSRELARACHESAFYWIAPSSFNILLKKYCLNNVAFYFYSLGKISEKSPFCRIFYISSNWANLVRTHLLFYIKHTPIFLLIHSNSYKYIGGKLLRYLI